MITRSHTKGDAPSTAVYSDCLRYRYSLTRVWAREGPQLGFVMLNPSTATEEVNDPTIERCERRARALGYGGVVIANIFALRATDPRVMRAAADPAGPDNPAALADIAGSVDMLIAAWGVHGAHCGQGPAVAARLRAEGHALFHLGLTAAGHPRHPLYVPYAVQPVLWAQAAAPPRDDPAR